MYSTGFWIETSSELTLCAARFFPESRFFCEWHFLFPALVSNSKSVQNLGFKSLVILENWY